MTRLLRRQRDRGHVRIEVGREGRKLTETTPHCFQVDDRFHRREHAIEVELPLIQVAWPETSVLPIEVPAISRATEIGVETANALQKAGLSAVFLASSDLTHYGPGYDFAPAGVGDSRGCSGPGATIGGCWTGGPPVG